MKNTFVNALVSFFQLYQLVKERILPLPQTLLYFCPLTETVAILLECYQYESRAIWDFCTKICIKSEITFMLMHFTMFHVIK